MEPLIPLSPLPPLAPLTGPARLGEQGTGGEPAFADVLKQALQEVTDVQAKADGEARNLMVGEGTDMHSAILAVQKADVSFQMMMAVRSKLIDAYREVMRMQM
jgi:flagellar hook-basal body complex protein FliE